MKRRTYLLNSHFTVIVILIFSSRIVLSPAMAQQASGNNIGDFSIQTLISLGIVQNPNNNPAQVSLINQRVGEARQNMADILPGAQSVPNIPDIYRQIVNYQSTLFEIKWGYIAKQDAISMVNNPDYWKDKQLLSQGCFPKCMAPPDPTRQPARKSGQGVNAVANQLRAMEATNLSGVKSPRRIDSQASDEEQTQLNAEVPLVVDFNHPETLPQASLGVGILDFSGTPDFDSGLCLTVDECEQLFAFQENSSDVHMEPGDSGILTSTDAQQQVGSAGIISQLPGSTIQGAMESGNSAVPSLSPHSQGDDVQSNQVQRSASDPGVADSNKLQGNGSAQNAGKSDSQWGQMQLYLKDSSANIEDTSELSSDKRGLFEDAVSALGRIKQTAVSDLEAIKSLTKSAAGEVVNYLPEYLLGKIDPMSPKVFTDDAVSNAGNAILELTGGKPQNGPIGDFIASFAARRVVTGIDSASNDIPGQDVNARLEFSLKKDILANIFNANSTVNGFKSFMGVVNDALSSQENQPQH